MKLKIETGFYLRRHNADFHNGEWITIYNQHEEVLCRLVDTPENKVYADIMVTALNAALENLTPANETPVATIEV